MLAGGHRILDGIDAVARRRLPPSAAARRRRLARRRARRAPSAPRRLRRRAAPHDPDEYCQQKAAQSGSSFYYSFLFLPPERRRAITALYAFCREVDDVVDEVADPGVARTQARLVARARSPPSFAGTPQHPVARALQPVVAAYGLPQEHFQTVIDGMAMDLERNRYLDFADARALLPSRGRRRRPAVGGDLRLHRTRARATTRATSASPSSSPTSSATSARTRAAAASTCRRTSSRGIGVTAVGAAAARESSDAFRALMADAGRRAPGRGTTRALAQLPRRGPRARSARASSWRRSTARCSTRSSATAIAVLDQRIALTPLRKLWIAWKTSRRPDARARPAAGRRVAVIGGGWAGCAAAVDARRGRASPVTLFEAARDRSAAARAASTSTASRSTTASTCCSAPTAQTLRLIAPLHGAPDAARLFQRLPLTLRPFGGRRRRGARSPRGALPAPLHLAGGIWRGARAVAGASAGARSRELPQAAPRRRLSMPANGRPSPSASPRRRARAFAGCGAPLCLAALNTPPEEASAQVFANVLRAAFAGSRARQRLPRPGDRPLRAASRSPRCGEVVAARRRRCALGVAVRVVATAAGARRRRRRAPRTFDSTARSSPSARTSSRRRSAPDVRRRWRPLPLAQSIVAGFAYESITTVYLGCDRPVPLAAPMLRLDDAPGQWAVRPRRRAPASATPANARGAARGRHQRAAARTTRSTRTTLARAVEAQLRRLAPGLPPPVVVPRHRRAARDLRVHAGARPPRERGRVAPGLYLAGDYTDPELPATLEAAMRSGCAAARSLAAQCRQRD